MCDTLALLEINTLDTLSNQIFSRSYLSIGSDHLELLRCMYVRNVTRFFTINAFIFFFKRFPTMLFKNTCYLCKNGPYRVRGGWRGWLEQGWQFPITLYPLLIQPWDSHSRSGPTESPPSFSIYLIKESDGEMKTGGSARTPPVSPCGGRGKQYYQYWIY